MELIKHECDLIRHALYVRLCIIETGTNYYRAKDAKAFNESLSKNDHARYLVPHQRPITINIIDDDQKRMVSELEALIDRFN